VFALVVQLVVVSSWVHDTTVVTRYSVYGTISVLVACKVTRGGEYETAPAVGVVLTASWLVVSGRTPSKEIEMDGVDRSEVVDGLTDASRADVVNREVDVDRPLAGQFDTPGAQLITVSTLVMNAVEIAGGTDVGGTMGWYTEAKTNEFVKMPSTTLLGSSSGVAKVCPVGPYISSAASSMLPSSLAWLGTGLTSSNSVQSPVLVSVAALKLMPTQKDCDVELSWLYIAHCEMQAVKSAAD